MSEEDPGRIIQALFAELMRPEVVIARIAESDEPLDRAVRYLERVGLAQVRRFDASPQPDHPRS